MEFDELDASPIEIVGKSSANEYFDEVIGHIEDIVLSLDFELLQNNFLEKNWQVFDYTEENKLIYTEIFQEYTSIFEQFFLKELCKRMPDFDMERFVAELDKFISTSELSQHGEIFELIYSLSDFQTFKELILDYRRRKEGKVQHLDFDILITKPLMVNMSIQP